ncbi:ATP-binding protein [Streptomyces chartreusis]|uniref:ATP-binding protein n=1 Tax=Streptomyces chartreusis TaxID=1969 RepID=UPI00365A7CE9
MTISHDTPPLSTFGLRVNAAKQGAVTSHGLPDEENSLEFRLGPEHTPIQSMRRARSFVAKVLPALLAGGGDAEHVEESVLAVLTELVDVTARHRASVDLSGRISCDRDHVLITVGDLGRPLPAPEEEPGLFLVHRLADDIGQHREDSGGYAVWASIPVRMGRTSS